MDVQYLALYVLAFGPLVGLVVSFVYFAKASSEATLSLRLLSSAFGPSLVLLWLLLGSPLWPDRLRYNDTGLRALYWLQLLPLVLLVFTVAKYPGNRRLHLLLEKWRRKIGQGDRWVALL
jgi:hypothetical protein